MLMSPWPYLILLGLVIIVVLAAYARRLLLQVKAQEVAAKKAKEAVQLKHNAHDSKIIKSVQIITRAMQAEQCDYSEGCWRLCVLLDSLKLSNSLDQQFPAIFELYNKIKHMQILDARKELAKRDRMKQDMERMKVEASLSAAISEDLSALLQYSQERLSVLKPV